MNPGVNAYFEQGGKWQAAVQVLRRILLDFELSEELKWGQPCYVFQKSNVAIIQDFKDYCAVMFFKGVLLQDAHRVLVSPGESQAVRQIRFTSADEVAVMEPIIRSYVSEAIEVERAGLKAPMKETSDFTIPEEFQVRLDEDPALKSAFEALTPGRQRAYLHHFAAPKQSTTRIARVEKSIPQILAGKGLVDL